MRVIENSEKEEKKAEVDAENSLKALLKSIANVKHLYIKFAEYFKEEGLLKLTRYFNELADEKLLQYTEVSEFLTDLGEKLPKISLTEIEGEIPERIQPFNISVKLEEGLVDQLNDLAAVCNKEENFLIFSKAMKWIPDQFDTEIFVKKICQLACEEDSSWLSKQIEILNYYSCR